MGRTAKMRQSASLPRAALSLKELTQTTVVSNNLGLCAKTENSSFTVSLSHRSFVNQYLSFFCRVR